MVLTGSDDQLSRLRAPYAQVVRGNRGVSLAEEILAEDEDGVSEAGGMDAPSEDDDALPPTL